MASPIKTFKEDTGFQTQYPQKGNSSKVHSPKVQKSKVSRVGCAHHVEAIVKTGMTPEDNGQMQGSAGTHQRQQKMKGSNMKKMQKDPKRILGFKPSILKESKCGRLNIPKSVATGLQICKNN
ncbi:MAG: hypothetical protein HZB79_03635 [Deltaproteobacteria bacterium]|nr:hypothetical protein [Deltaproteobacteria bacterium]